MLNEMITFFVLHCGFRDKFFLEFEMPIAPWGHSSRFFCRRIDSNFTFGFDYTGFFIETDIRHPEHLKRMDDEFWSALSSLQSMGKLEFVNNAGFSSSQAIQAAKHFKARSSAVFTLIRNAVLFEVFERDGLQDLGWLEVKWPIGTPWQSILENGLAAFCKLYKANYLLYRAEYIQSHRSQAAISNE